MKKTLIVVGALIAFSYAAFVPPDGVSKMPIKQVNLNIDSPFMSVNASLSGDEPSTPAQPES
ncbi:hypothetical protein FJZ28_03645 [Candidatus Peregrinibacteria bacterium]|nr:hypothetical protein [Candidatus Peregrinibacteria bacterium]